MHDKLQVRHKDLGIFQGMCMGMAFWWRADDPELDSQLEFGICHQDNVVDCQKLIDWLCTMQAENHPELEEVYRLKPADFTIEPLHTGLLPIHLNRLAISAEHSPTSQEQWDRIDAAAMALGVLNDQD